jgi:hypothetical protein
MPPLVAAHLDPVFALTGLCLDQNAHPDRARCQLVQEVHVLTHQRVLVAAVAHWFNVSELTAPQYRSRRMLESWEKARNRRLDG